MSAAAVVVSVMWPLSGWRYSVRLQLVCQKSLTPSVGWRNAVHPVVLSSGRRVLVAVECMWIVGQTSSFLERPLECFPASQHLLPTDFLQTLAYVFWELWREEGKILNTFDSWKWSYVVVERSWVLTVPCCDNDSAVGTGNLLLDFQALWSSLCHSPGALCWLCWFTEPLQVNCLRRI